MIEVLRWLYAITFAIFGILFAVASVISYLSPGTTQGDLFVATAVIAALNLGFAGALVISVRKREKQNDR